MFTEILRGFSTTFKEIFSKPVTIAYPEVKRPVRSRFKGRHVLKRYDNGHHPSLDSNFVTGATT